MKVYKTQSEVEKDVKDDILTIEGNVRFECSISILASIKVIAGNINAGNINAWNITAKDITARNIDVGNIKAENITARNIDAGNITARNIYTTKDIDAWNINARNIYTAKDIDAWNINAWNINAENIVYYAFCIAYNSIQCISIKAKRKIHAEPICLDGKLTIKSKRSNKMNDIHISKCAKCGKNLNLLDNNTKQEGWKIGRAHV